MKCTTHTVLIRTRQSDKYNKTLIDIAVEYLNVPQVQYLMSKLYKLNHI